jgi:threonine dehydrogenase-like Zn-dependent dehydrogenase
VYTSPIRVTADQTIKDVAVEAAGNKSPVATFAYSVGTTASPAANPVPHAFPAGTPVVNTAPQLYDITIFPERDFVVADGYEPNTHLNKKVIIAATAEAAYPDPNENGKLIVKGTAMGEDGNRLPIERLERTVMTLAAEEKIGLKPLVTHVFGADEAGDAFRLLDESPGEAVQVVLEF